MGEPSKPLALPDIHPGLTEDDQVAPLPRMPHGRRKFSLFGLLPEASNYRVPQQRVIKSTQEATGQTAVAIKVNNVSPEENIDREQRTLTRSSSWSNFITASVVHDVGSPPSIYNDNFSAEPNIPSAYDIDSSKNMGLQGGEVQHRYNLVESMQSLYSPQAMESYNNSALTNMTKEKTMQNNALGLPEKNVHRSQSSSALAALQNEVKEFKSSVKPTMPPPPAKPRKVRVRKQEINMFAPTSM